MSYRMFSNVELNNEDWKQMAYFQFVLVFTICTYIVQTRSYGDFNWS